MKSLSKPASWEGAASCSRLLAFKVVVVVLLEAFGAMALLIFIVWWTMFSGRKGGERAELPEDDEKK